MNQNLLKKKFKTFRVNLKKKKKAQKKQKKDWLTCKKKIKILKIKRMNYNKN